MVTLTFLCFLSPRWKGEVWAYGFPRHNCSRPQRSRWWSWCCSQVSGCQWVETRLPSLCRHPVWHPHCWEHAWWEGPKACASLYHFKKLYVTIRKKRQVFHAVSNLHRYCFIDPIWLWWCLITVAFSWYRDAFNSLLNCHNYVSMIFQTGNKRLFLIKCRIHF